MNKLELRRIVIFIAFTFVVSYAWVMFLIWPRTLGVDAGALSQEKTVVTTLLTATLMFFPALGVAVTRLATGEGFRNSMLRPNFRGNWRYYLVAWFGPMILTSLGAMLYYLLFPSKFSFEMFHPLLIDRSGILLIVTMLLSPLLNLIPCFGEEWGWRGYLLPKVAERMNFIPAVLLTGFIWGVWHAPIIVAGHNYGTGYPGYPWLGIVAMCIFCIVVGVFFSYIALRAKSCWPAVLAHGAINGTAGMGMLFYNSNYALYLANNAQTPELLELDRFVGPMPIGVIGGAAYIIVAFLIIKKEYGKKKANC